MDIYIFFRRKLTFIIYRYLYACVLYSKDYDFIGKCQYVNIYIVVGKYDYEYKHK